MRLLIIRLLGYGWLIDLHLDHSKKQMQIADNLDWMIEQLEQPSDNAVKRLNTKFSMLQSVVLELSRFAAPLNNKKIKRIIELTRLD